MTTVKGKDLKALVAGLDDEADVLISLNGNQSDLLLVYSCTKNQDGALVLDTVHYCND